MCCSWRSQKSIKILILEVHGLSKSLMLIQLESWSLVLAVRGSMFIPICNCFHERLANNGKVITFTGVLLSVDLYFLVYNIFMSYICMFVQALSTEWAGVITMVWLACSAADWNSERQVELIRLLRTVVPSGLMFLPPMFFFYLFINAV